MWKPNVKDKENDFWLASLHVAYLKIKFCDKMSTFLWNYPNKLLFPFN